VSIAGMAKALRGALDLHADYPNNAAALKGKRAPAPEYPSPEHFPTLKGKYKATLDYAGKVVPSCIHCHQIGDAQKELHRAKGEPMPGKLLFPYPHPKSQGLILDPKEKATVVKVEPGSSAEQSGFKAGDVIQTLDSQPMISIADVQWVLHQQSGNGGRLPVKILRDGKPVDLTWRLERAWRTKDDISWRSSSWGLRRMATGGLLLEETESGLRVKHVGEYGAHAAAKNAGFQKGDIVALYDGKEFKRETDLLAHGVTERKPGDKVPVTVLRNGKKVELTLPMQQ
jgi:serine protease Do